MKYEHLILHGRPCSFSSYIKKNKNDLTIMNLHGDVKSFKEFSYKAIDHFGDITKGDRERKGANDDELLFLEKFDFNNIFNKDGNCIESNTYNSNGVSNEKWTYKYNRKCNIVKTKHFEPLQILKHKYIYKYNKKGNCILTKQYNSCGYLIEKEIKKYDSKGRIIESSSYIYGSKYNIIKAIFCRQAKRLDVKWTYKYDDNHNTTEIYFYLKDVLNKRSIDIFDSKYNLIESYSYKPDGNLDRKSSSIYDNSGNKIETNFSYGNGKLNGKNLCKYDDNANEIEQLEYYSNRLYKKMNYKYEYDLYNNWLKRIDFENDKAKYIIEREIEYY